MATDDGCEAERLHRARAFDPGALTSIYDEYRHPIYSYILRQVGDVETARDLTSDVFRRFLQAVHASNGPDHNAKAWLYRTAHNIVIDFYRGQRFRRHAPLNVDMFSHSEDPLETVQRNVETSEVLEAWLNLTPDQQQVIALKFMHELSNQETASVLGKPITAIKALQRRGLAALRRQLVKAEESVQL